MIDLKDRRILVTGVANKNSIAWGITEAILKCGGTPILTYQNERLRDRVMELANSVSPSLPAYELDATNSAQVADVFARLDAEYGGLDGLVHSIAFAKREDLSPGISRVVWENFEVAIQVSSYTLIELSRAAAPLMRKRGGGSIITLTYDTTKVFPAYNVMGIAKSTLEASMRYLAWDLGRSNIRVNAVSAGPIKTLAARGISNFTEMFEMGAKKSPLGRNVTLEEVGGLSAFLLSPLGGGITGQTIFVDAGQSIVTVDSAAFAKADSGTPG